MGVGKTTIGRELAAHLGRQLLDSDSALEAGYGMTGGEIASSRGVRRLHAVELEMLIEMIESPLPAVIAPAASVVDADEGREILSENLTIWLDAPGEVLAKRRDRDDSHRRQVDGHEVMLLERRRRPLWQDVATLRIDTSAPLPDVVDEVLSEVHRLRYG
jgi:shikimate kinase